MYSEPPPSFRIHEGKLAIVTGSARSIGAAIARKLASQGCNIVINYATAGSDAPAAALASELESAHQIRTLVCRADISKKAECERLVSAAEEHFSSTSTSTTTTTDTGSGRRPPFQIDILIHNAAILYLGPLESVSEPDFHHIYSVNVLGPTFLTAACLPHLPRDRSGRVVLMSSINPKVGTPHTSLYSGTKAAVEALTRVWSRELAERATVNAINPGPVMTDMYLTAPEETKKGLAMWNPMTPLSGVREEDSSEVREIGDKFGGRPAYDWEIAGLVAMLCSAESRWCTGSLVCANGGLSFSL